MTEMPVVVKVGGSLFDLPDLGLRLHCWLKTLNTRDVCLVPGGGRAADAIRDLDRGHGLGEETAHWLALRAMTLNAHFLAALVPSSVVDGEWEGWGSIWRDGRMVVLDAYHFTSRDEGRPGCLPHSWAVTSDSVAARVAGVIRAGRLVILKSMAIPTEISLDEAGRRGWVDSYFAQAVADVAGTVQTLNLRAWQT
jgi:aspartokinase-like uncharacterized kinase